MGKPTSAPEFLNFYGAQETILRNRFGVPIDFWKVIIELNSAVEKTIVIFLPVISPQNIREKMFV
jgi:hypothetical protein